MVGNISQCKNWEVELNEKWLSHDCGVNGWWTNAIIIRVGLFPLKWVSYKTLAWFLFCIFSPPSLCVAAMEWHKKILTRCLILNSRLSAFQNCELVNFNIKWTRTENRCKDWVVAVPGIWNCGNLWREKAARKALVSNSGA